MRFLSIFTFLLCLFCFEATAQNKRDYQWIIGGNSGGGGVLLDFNHSPVEITYQQTKVKMEGSNTSMSDKSGNLLFYSNGCKVINAQGAIMKNGDDINPGIIQDFYCSSASGSPLAQGVISIPSPEGDSIYYVFNLDYDQSYLLEPNFYGVAPQRLYYQKIDMAQDSGFGAVVLKN